jgi:hypothetical protein
MAGCHLAVQIPDIVVSLNIKAQIATTCKRRLRLASQHITIYSTHATDFPCGVASSLLTSLVPPSFNHLLDTAFDEMYLVIIPDEILLQDLLSQPFSGFM